MEGSPPHPEKVRGPPGGATGGEAAGRTRQRGQDQTQREGPGERRGWGQGRGRPDAGARGPQRQGRTLGRSEATWTL